MSGLCAHIMREGKKQTTFYRRVRTGLIGLTTLLGLGSRFGDKLLGV